MAGQVMLLQGRRKLRRLLRLVLWAAPSERPEPVFGF